MTAAFVVMQIPNCIERLWRWSWLRMRWEPIWPADQWVFREGGCLEGIEQDAPPDSH